MSMKRNFMVFVLALMLGAFTFAGCATQTGGKKGSAAGSAGSDGSGSDLTRGVGVQESGKIYSSSLDKSFDADANGDGSGTVYDVFFAYDKYALSTQARDILDNNAKIFSRNKGAKITIEGHCDDRGSNEYNIALGDRRAQSVKKYLTRVGVDGDDINTVSYGEEKPFCEGVGNDCWQKNRRAHFVVKY